MGLLAVLAGQLFEAFRGVPAIKRLREVGVFAGVAKPDAALGFQLRQIGPPIGGEGKRWGNASQGMLVLNISLLGVRLDAGLESGIDGYVNRTIGCHFKLPPRRW